MALKNGLRSEPLSYSKKYNPHKNERETRDGHNNERCPTDRFSFCIVQRISIARTLEERQVISTSALFMDFSGKMYSQLNRNQEGRSVLFLSNRSFDSS